MTPKCSLTRTAKTRPVATYADPQHCSPFPPLDTRTEIVTTVHDIVFDSSKGTKKYKVALINVYALKRPEHNSASIREIKDYILTQTKELRKEGIRKVLVFGDFNEEQVSLPDFHEIMHQDMAHRHNSNARSKYIDKVFANFRDASIRSVYSTCEHRDREAPLQLGHKSILIQIGRSPTQKTTRSLVSFKKL